MKTSKIFCFVLLNCLLQFSPVYCSSDDLVENWKKINASLSNDIQQSFQIYSKIREEQCALAELRTLVERFLRTKNAELLVNAMSSSNISMTANNLKDILIQLNNNYNKQMVEGIIAEAINEMSLTIKLSRLPDILWRIYEENDKHSFELMLRAQLQLYNNFGQKHHTDKTKFLHNFSNRLYKIKHESLYDTVDLSLKLKVQNIVEQLPYNLKYLYFMPYFCLLNIKYSTYIYTAIEAKVDPLSRYIWLWHDNISMDDTGYIEAEVGSMGMDNNDEQLVVALKGTKYKMYYYMMPSTMKIAGWDSTATPVNSIWNIEFLDDDRVVFSQNDYLMCAVENHDNERRNVGGRKRGQVSSMSPECQWRLGKCLFR